MLYPDHFILRGSKHISSKFLFILKIFCKCLLIKKFCKSKQNNLKGTPTNIHPNINIPMMLLCLQKYSKHGQLMNHFRNFPFLSFA